MLIIHLYKPNIDMPESFFMSASKPLIFELSESVLEYKYYQIFNFENVNYVIYCIFNDFLIEMCKIIISVACNILLIILGAIVSFKIM